MIRKAVLSDAPDIQRLINLWSRRRRVLERSLNYICEHIRDFRVYVTGRKKVAACCALGIYGWQGIAEIKSLVVKKDYQGKGIGAILVEHCLKEAHALGVSRVFALTYIPEFFMKLGFKKVNRNSLPQKIWNDCVHCPDFPDCKEIAVILDIKK